MEENGAGGIDDFGDLGGGGVIRFSRFLSIRGFVAYKPNLPYNCIIQVYSVESELTKLYMVKSGQLYVSRGCYIPDLSILGADKLSACLKIYGPLDKKPRYPQIRYTNRKCFYYTTNLIPYRIKWRRISWTELQLEACFD